MGKLVDVGASDYYESEQMVNVVTNTASYSVPTYYFSTIGVDILLDNGDYHTIKRYNLSDRNLYESDYIAPCREDYTYRIRGENIFLSPTPNFTATNGIKHLYVATPPPLDNTLTDENIDGIFGWEDYIVYDCLIKFIGGKEEGDATQWEKLMGKTNERIEALKQKRDRANPDTIVNCDDEYSPYGRGYSRYGVSV